MYENNENYPQNTNTTENNNGYHEYYYSSGQTINTSPTPPSQNNKKKSGRGKKAVTVVCLGLVFGVTAGAAFSVPVTIANKELKATKLEIQQMQESLNAAA